MKSARSVTVFLYFCTFIAVLLFLLVSQSFGGDVNRS